MKKRDRLTVIHDILKVIQEKKAIKPTPLLRFANLSTSGFTEYITDLLTKELIKEKEIKERKHYVLTDKGHRFLEKYTVILGFIDEFEL